MVGEELLGYHSYPGRITNFLLEYFPPAASELGGLHQPRLGGPAEDPALHPGGNPAAGGAPLTPPLEAPTVPDEDFFNLIQRLQSGRLEDQRATLQPK